MQRANAVVALALLTLGCQPRRPTITVDGERDLPTMRVTMPDEATLRRMSKAVAADGAGPLVAPGTPVTVHFRRDALGLSGGAAGLDYGGPQRDSLRVVGAYVADTPGFVTLDADGRRLFIPVAQVLAVEAAAPTTTRPG